MTMGPADRELPGAWLRRVREAAGLTQEELAERAGLSPRAIGNLERGTGRPYPKSVRLVVTALGLSSAASDDLIASYRRTAAGPKTAPSEPPVAAPYQLPAAIPQFVGRAAELAWLNRALEESPGSAVALSAINGMAGVGKTALALHWAHLVAARFPDGQLYVNLRGYD